MPEYLAPGVYIEETSYRSKSIEGVSTTTTGFIGPCRFGPVDRTPELVTSLADFERRYGDGRALRFTRDGAPYELPNYMWHAARAFFTEGGRRLYVSRVFRPRSDSNDGVSSATFGALTVRARFPGELGNHRVRLRLQLGQNVLGQLPASGSAVRSTIGALREHDLVFIRRSSSPSSPPESPPESPPASPLAGATTPEPRPGTFYLARLERGTTNSPQSPPASPPGDTANRAGWVFDRLAGEGGTLTLADLANAPDAELNDSIQVATLSVTVASHHGAELGTWSDLHLDPRHRRGDTPDSIFEQFGDDQHDASLPITLRRTGDGANDGLAVLRALFGDAIAGEDVFDPVAEETFSLENGNDGERPGVGEYEGLPDPATTFKTGLTQFEDLEDISIVAAPGSTADYEQYRDDANAIMGLLIAHARTMRYRVAVLDSAMGHSVADVRKVRAKIDSTHAALYYPWVTILDPITRQRLQLPPSGFVAGIYARNDVNRAVFKAPANEVVNLAIDFEYRLNHAEQEVLNPEGINCFRFHEGRGMLLWGARTISSDPEWKYLNLRRYFAYVERSIEKGAQWAVFEPNGQLLWDNVRRTIDDFLFNEWQMGALLGEKPNKAYFVRCDRSTMTQNDLDNGRLVCQIGLAVVRPAEFVIFRIGQWTGDAQR